MKYLIKFIKKRISPQIDPKFSEKYLLILTFHDSMNVEIYLQNRINSNSINTSSIYIPNNFSM